MNLRNNISDGPMLGLVLAGGRSRRFGSDKAMALLGDELGGQTLIARAVDQLSGWCDQVVIVGRTFGPAPCLPDWPRPDMGPLAGIAAALRFAADENFATVLSCGVDNPLLPENLPELLGPAPAFLAAQPVVGRWPANASAAIEAILLGDGKHSMRRFAETIGARAVELCDAPPNINTPEDLAAINGHA